ncbi:MAG TPA: hypothetical protein VL171_13930 [Verrucomicrobiae bacterium]|nr:hypothetical protein [Verrucomicrobiae bacterium]
MIRMKQWIRILVGPVVFGALLSSSHGTVLIDESFAPGYNRTNNNIAGANMAIYKGRTNTTATVNVGSLSFSNSTSLGASGYWGYFTDPNANLAGIGSASSVSNGHLLLGVGDKLTVSISFYLGSMPTGTSTYALRFGLFDSADGNPVRSTNDANAGPSSNAFTNNQAFAAFLPMTTDTGLINQISLRRRTTLTAGNPLSSSADWTSMGSVGGAYTALSSLSNYTLQFSVSRPDSFTWTISAALMDTLSATVLTSGSVSTNSGLSSFNWFQWRTPSEAPGNPDVFTDMKVEVDPLPVANFWIASTGKWEYFGNWSNGVPSTNDAADVINNSNSSFVTIDALTVGSFPSSLMINNLLVSAPAGFSNTLLVSATGGTNPPLSVLNSLGVSAGGSVIVSNGELRVGGISTSTLDGSLVVLGGGKMSMNGPFSVGDQGTGAVTLVGGTFVATNSSTIIGNLGMGSVTVSNSALTANLINIGSGANSIGSLTISSNSTANLSSNLTVASGSGSSGTVSIVGGSLAVANGVFGIGNTGVLSNGTGIGSVTVSNGTLTASTILLGSSAGGQGDLILQDGGMISCPGGTNCLIAINSLGFGQVGGTLTWVGSTLEIGVSAVGDYNLSGGSAVFDDLYAGYGDVGTMTLAGGVANVNSRLIIGHLGSPLANGSVWITGGTLTILNNYTIIGNSGVGQMTISNGTVTADAVFVGNSGNDGSLSVAGGTMAAFSGISVGDCGAGFNGFVTIVGGDLFITNASHNAVLDVRSGTTTISGGLLKVDKLIVTNSCARLLHTGGSLQYSQVQLDPSLSAVGDGIPNSWKLQYGLDPFDPNAANEDPDGDGLSNLREYQLGTNPSDSSSPYRITAVTREGNDIRVTWTTAGGTTNVVQVGTGAPNGSYTNSFSDLSPQLIIPGATVTSTNYLDSNGATNNPARYYRIRVLP